jgi:3-oxoacyl-[acyl-carrier protein] reductase
MQQSIQGGTRNARYQTQRQSRPDHRRELTIWHRRGRGTGFRGASWGRIINISTDGAPGFSSEVSYGASKYALETYSRAAAKELGQFGITINVMSLGPIQTGWIAPELERSVEQHTPLGRVGRPEDVADAMLLLAADQARWITGQVIYVGGGHRMV